MADCKTPVMLLQEYCTQRKITHPFYEDLPEELAEANKRIFSVQCSAVSKSAIGKGLNKKNAKHHAAANVLRLLGERVNYVCDLETNDDKQSPVTTLMDLCIQRHLPLAEFTEIQAVGPSHCPEFTIQCKVATLVREAKAPSKSKAKAKAASLVLNILQEMQMNDPDQLKVMEIKDAIEIEEEKEEDVVRTYREYKKLENKAPPGVRLCDRHNFWANMDKEKVAQAKRYLIDKNETLPERINLAMSALKIKFNIKNIPSYGETLKTFELDHKDYECFFVSLESQFWSDLYEYFLIMLNVVQY